MWSGKNPTESDGSNLWMTAVVGRKQANPPALSKIPLSCQTCKCQSRARNRRLQLSGFCLAFLHLEPPNTPFRTGWVLCGRKALPSVLHCGSHDHCVFCVMPSRRGRRARPEGGKNLLIAPGPHPFHFAPRVPESHQLLWMAPEIHLQGPQRQLNRRAYPCCPAFMSSPEQTCIQFLKCP